ncbi:hypothetical protein [Paraburkholderia aromaticivorans]|uniref:hypothetical protein n=1 Tax=Paraburkholderia aromaticivorans TaxID=2026199 RepID=UPI0012FE0F7A|nr:hypothetical protein [Paraburkholderia aromaticivorans]
MNKVSLLETPAGTEPAPRQRRKPSISTLQVLLIVKRGSDLDSLIDRLQKQTGEAYARYGVGSEQYEQLFDDLHCCRMVRMAFDFRDARGLPPGRPTPYDDTDLAVWLEEIRKAPEQPSWSCLCEHFGLDESFQYSEAQREEYFRLLSHEHATPETAGELLKPAGSMTGQEIDDGAERTVDGFVLATVRWSGSQLRSFHLTRDEAVSAMNSSTDIDDLNVLPANVRFAKNGNIRYWRSTGEPVAHRKMRGTEASLSGDQEKIK